MKGTSACVVICAALAATPAGRANPLDTYGFGPRIMAMGGAGTAAATDVDAAYYNPAAATRVGLFALTLGSLYADDRLAVSGQDAQVDGTALVQLGLSTPIPGEGAMRRRIFLTVAATLPTSGIFDVRLPDDEALTFPFWGARNRRLALLGTAALRVTDWLSVGGGASLMATVDSAVDVALTGGQSDNSVGVQIGYHLAPVAGLLVEPWSWLAAGLTYRGRQSMPLRLPVDVEVLDGVAPVYASIRGVAFDTPQEVSVGVQTRPWPGAPRRLVLAADLTWAHYAETRYASPDVEVRDRGGEILRESRATPVTLLDTWSVRLGAEWAALPWLQLRAGWAWVPSPVPAQTGATNLLDADRQVLSAGVGLYVPESSLWSGVRALRVDLYGQLHVLSERTSEKAEFLPDNPGFPQVTLSGLTWSAGGAVRLLF